jgi:coenzyme F420 hydrogenase subunit beta
MEVSTDMTKEGDISWVDLKNIADTLDSYRVRNFIDSKEDILESGVYNENEYDAILFDMIDQETLKYALLNYLVFDDDKNLSSIREFSDQKSVKLKKVLSLLKLLEAEGLISLEKIYKDEEEQSELEDLSINIETTEPSEIKPIYEPVQLIFDEEICSGCGLCAGICPMDCIEIENGYGSVDDDICIRCGLCYYVCPRTYLPTEILNMYQEDGSEVKDFGNIGFFLEAYSARTKIDEVREVCQDGGVTSTCLHYLFDNGMIDYAIGAKMADEPWRPEPTIIENKDQILETAGTKYVNNANLSMLNREELTGKKIAVTGVPCQMQALLKNEVYDIGFPSLNAVEYRLGIFCMESFSYNDGFLEICDKLDVDVNNVRKTDINKGKFFIYTEDGEELAAPIKEVTSLAREDCEVCFDLTSESADISIGSIGAPSGWNCVLIRTQKGKELFEALLEHDLIESKPISEVKPGLGLLKKIAGGKRKKSQKHIDNKRDVQKPFPKY